MNRTVVAAMSYKDGIETAEVEVEAVSGKLNSIDEFYEVLADYVTHEMKSEDCFEILKSSLHLYKNDRSLMEKDKTNIIRVLYASYSKMVMVDGKSMKEGELLALDDSERTGAWGDWRSRTSDTPPRTGAWGDWRNRTCIRLQCNNGRVMKAV